MTTRAAHAETVRQAREAVFRAFGPTPGRTQAVYDALDAFARAVRHEAGADRLHPHEDGADNDQARLAPSSAIAPEKLTNASTTEAVSENGRWSDDDLKYLLEDIRIPVAASAQASHFMDGFKRKPDTDEDRLLQRVDAAISSLIKENREKF